MLYQTLSNTLRDRGDLPAIISGSETLTYAQLLSQTTAAAEYFHYLRGEKVGLMFKDGAPLIIALVALSSLGIETYLIGAEWPGEKVAALAEELALNSLLTEHSVMREGFHNRTVSARPPESASTSGESRVVIFTSGTTGKPKGALHTWRSLSAGIKVDPKFEGSRWLLTYGLTRF